MDIDGTPTIAERTLIEAWATENPDIIAVAIEDGTVSARRTRDEFNTQSGAVKQTDDLRADLDAAAASARS